MSDIVFTTLPTLSKATPLPVQCVEASAVLPSQPDDGNAGIDLRSAFEYDIEPGQICSIDTGIAVELPKGTCGLVLGRSGLAFKTNIFVLHVGLIDASYRGKISVLLLNFGYQKFHISIGDRIAQLLVLPYMPTSLNQVASLSESTRGTQGFGSTGIA